MKILIPTCRSQAEIDPLLYEIRRNTPGAHLVWASCAEGASASVNRNLCLDVLTVGERAIMLDDDICGFSPGWDDDLMRGFEAMPNVVMVSARLLNRDGSFGPTCSRCYNAWPEEIEVDSERKHCILPTAAIAFEYRHRFDPAYVGSGFEDNDLVAQYRAADPTCAFIQSNRCRLIHINEMKNQKGANWSHNQRLFRSKWPGGIPTRVKSERQTA